MGYRSTAKGDENVGTSVRPGRRLPRATWDHSLSTRLISGWEFPNWNSRADSWRS